MASLFPGLEPRARGIAESFVAAIQELGFVGIDGSGTPSKKHLKEIEAGARDFVMQVGEKPALLKRVVREMREKDLVIATPRSCIKMARQKSQWQEPTQENVRERYTGGEFADAVRH